MAQAENKVDIPETMKESQDKVQNVQGKR